MSATRSAARSLRSLTNAGYVCLEELGDLSEVIGEDVNATVATQAKKDNVRKLPNKPAKAANESKPVEDAKPATAQNSQNNADDYPKEEQKSPANNQQPAKPAEDKPSTSASKLRSETKIPQMSEAQRSALLNLSRRRNISIQELDDLAKKIFNVSFEEISASNASTLIRQIQTAA